MRTMNFSAGPACMPLSVLEEAQSELLDYKGSGRSLLESSHRGAEYDEVHSEAQTLTKELLGLGDDYSVLFFGGGASTQFAMVPMNLLRADRTADYILTGSWSKKAAKEAKLFGKVNIAASSETENFTRIPRQDELNLTSGAAYVHLTSNNTIAGTQWREFPQVSAPLVADMSSDILSRRFDATKFALIYAGAQKNLGPAGVTLVVIRKDLLKACNEKLPMMFHYPQQADAQSLANTPPCYAIYLLGKTLKWIKGQGGVAAVERANDEKQALLYQTIDANADFFRCPVEPASRSWMNVVFRLPTEELEKQFIAAAKTQGMDGIKGHRSVGGIRFSIYNAAPHAWIEAATSFMKDFAAKHG